MYIRRIYLKNIRCFEEVEIELEPLGSSALIIGDNGDGKSTVLRSLAIGLCDESSAAALFRELPEEFVRHGKEKDGGKIVIELGGRGTYSYKIVTRIRSGKTFERVEQKLFRVRGKVIKELPQDKFPWGSIFVSGYGAGGRTQGTADFRRYRAVDAVYSLFRYDEPLQNPELIVRRLVENVRLAAMVRAGASAPQMKNGKVDRGTPLPRFWEAEKKARQALNDVQQVLTSLLDLEKGDEVRLGTTGIEVEKAGTTVGLGALGDGRKATVTWVLDLLSWWLLCEHDQAEEHEWYRDMGELEGIVIVDEIEQHLHARWQRYILTWLKKSFPKIQFIMSTHSPLCAAGTADLGDRGWQLLRLAKSKETSEAKRIPLPRGLRADQILTSGAFGLPETRNPEVGEKVSRYYELLLRPKLKSKEKVELKGLREFVTKNVPEAGQFEVERRIRDELRNLVEKIEGLRKKKRDR